ncbi:MAG: HEAT repeat domain-containing protein [Pseudomonadota bacterium]
MNNGPGLRGLVGLVLILALGGCRSGTTEEGPEVTPGPAAERVVEVPAVDPCVISSIEVHEEGGGDRIPEDQVRGWLDEGLRARAVPRDEGAAGALRVVYLLTALEGGAGWSLGVKALWEVMDGPLRRPIAVDVALDLPLDADLQGAASEVFEALSGTLTFRCRLSTVPSDSLPRLRAGLARADDLVAWARACGDRKVTACGDGLTELLKDERSQVAAAAVVALGQAGVEAAIPAIVERTTRADSLVVRAAVLSLGELGSEEARRYLRLWSEGHPDPEMRAFAKEMMDLD